MPVTLDFVTPDARSADCRGTMVVGTKARLLAKDVRSLLPRGTGKTWKAMVDRLKATTAHDGVHPLAQPVHRGARLRPGDPAGLAVRGGDAPVQGARQLEDHERTPALTNREKTPVLLAALGLAHPHPHLHARPAQALHAASRDRAVWVDVTHDDAPQALLHHQLRARRGAPDVEAGLEGHRQRGTVHGAGAATPPGLLDRHHLGVGAAHRAGVAPAEDPVAPVHHGAHRGVREAPPPGAARLSQSEPHGGFGRHHDAPVSRPEPSIEAKNFA